jgi:uncharacterized protein (DUF433 family)
MDTTSRAARGAARPQAADESETWTYLEARPHRWRKQLYVKGHRLRASDIWYWVAQQGTSREDAAANWELRLEAIDECLRYSESHRELLDAEAEEVGKRLTAAGHRIEPPPAR